jgi:hypothetical protein
MTGAVHEPLAIARFGDDGARGRVDLLTRRAHRCRAHARLLRGDEHVVGVADLGVDVADHEHARDVGAVAVHGAAEVAEHDVAGLDDPVARIVMGAGRVRARGDDGEVGAFVAALEHALDELAVHVELGTPPEGPRPHRCRDLVDDRGRRPQRLDLGGVFHHAHRARHLAGPAERHVGKRLLEVKHEASPRVVADRGGAWPRRCPPDDAGDDRDRIVGLVPGEHLERLRSRHHARRLERGDHEHRVTLDREHEHGQTLERHRLVAGQVGQVGAGREQERVDAQVAHARSRAGHAFRIHRQTAGAGDAAAPCSRTNGCEPGIPARSE